jgi:hypothetical protein
MWSDEEAQQEAEQKEEEEEEVVGRGCEIKWGGHQKDLSVKGNDEWYIVDNYMCVVGCGENKIERGKM